MLTCPRTCSRTPSTAAPRRVPRARAVVKLCLAVAHCTLLRCGAPGPADGRSRSAWAGQAGRAARTSSAARHAVAAPVATGCEGSAGICVAGQPRQPLGPLGAAARVAPPTWARQRHRSRAGGAAAPLRAGKLEAGRGSLLRRRRAGTSAGCRHRRPAGTGRRRRLLQAAGAGDASRPRVKAPTPSHRPAALPRRWRSDGPVWSRLRLSDPPHPRCALCRGELTPLSAALPLLSSHSRRRWRSTTSRRTLPPSSRRSSTRSTAPHGTASWAATSVRAARRGARRDAALTSARDAQART